MRNKPLVLISALHVYPIKSCAGVSVQSMNFTQDGPDDDRQYLLCDERGVFVSQRSHPKLALVKTHLENGVVNVTIPRVGGLSLRKQEEPGEAVQVMVHNDECIGFRHSKQADDLFSTFLGKKVSLLRHYPTVARQRESKEKGKPVQLRFADSYPVTIVSAEALFELNKRLVKERQRAVSIERFRPTVVVDGPPAHDEDLWKSASVGGVQLRFENHCSRCSIPNIDPESGVLDRLKPVTNALYAYRRLDPKSRDVYFSSNFGVELFGGASHHLNVGDELKVEYQTAQAAA